METLKNCPLTMDSLGTPELEDHDDPWTSVRKVPTEGKNEYGQLNFTLPTLNLYEFIF